MFFNASAQRYTNIFSVMRGPIDWQAISDSVAPNVPEYLYSHTEENEKYKEVVLEWIYSFPDEFDAAKELDSRMNLYVHWAMQGDHKRKDGTTLYGNPPFMYMPVNEHKPVFIDTHNPDQDSLVYKEKLKNWYFNQPTQDFERLYGERPEVLPYPKLITHPSQFSDAVGTSNYEFYYPEFSEDPRVFNQYLEIYNEQYGDHHKSEKQ